jgi:hypothetical protein
MKKTRGRVRAFLMGKYLHDLEYACKTYGTVMGIHTIINLFGG